MSFVSEFAIRRASDNKVVAASPIDNYALKPHFTDGWGFLSAFRLPPGDYIAELFAVNPMIKYVNQKPIQFSLRGGQIVYLGEANLSKAGGSLRVTMRDQSQRDLPMFIARNP